MGFVFPGMRLVRQGCEFEARIGAVCGLSCPRKPGIRYGISRPRIPSPNTKFMSRADPPCELLARFTAWPLGDACPEKSSVILRDLGRQMQLKDRPMR